MTTFSKLEALGEMVIKKRGKVGIRKTAGEIGLSPATLSRVENGQLPDLANFVKLCRWLEVDPADILGFDPDDINRPTVAIHFRSRQTLAVNTAAALQDLILAGQQALNENDD